MEKNYVFVGFRHLKGKSQKSGRDYDFFVCHFVCDFPSYVLPEDSGGQMTDDFQINNELFYKLDMADKVGKSCQILFNQFGRVDTIVF